MTKPSSSGHPWKRLVALLRRIDWPLAAILLIAAALRFSGIGYGLPYTYWPDEPTRWDVALRTVQTGDLNPHWLGYPHLAFYLNALVLFVYYLGGRLVGAFSSPFDIPYPEVITIGVGKLAMPQVFLLARGLTALFAVGAILLIYFIGCKLTHRRSVALVAAFCFAFSPAAIANSAIISLDAFGVFFTLLAMLLILPILDETGARPWAFGGIGVGLAVSGKYNVGLIGVALVAALLLRFGWRGLARREPYLALIVAIITFAAFNPFSILDLNGFIYGLTMASDSQSGYAGAVGNGYLWYLAYLWSTEGLIVALAALQAIRVVYTRSKHGIVLLSFVIVYYLFVSQFSVRNDRTILPIIPFLDVLAAWFVADVADWLIARRRERLWATGTVFLACAVLLFQPLRTTLAIELHSSQSDGRESARRWIDSNLPAGSRIAVEGYSPYVDTRRFVVAGYDTITRHPPEWYAQSGFEYIVLSQGMYGRFFGDPEGYSDLIAEYRNLFTRFPQVARFDDNGYEIRILKTGVTLPVHRVAARFGDTADLVELVGYDSVQPKWDSGAPLQLRLTWRRLSDGNQPLQLVLRLRDEEGREVSSTTDDLNQSRPENPLPADSLFTSEWDLPLGSAAVPGLYYVDVDVIQARYAYHAPATTWRGDKIDTVSLGPFKQSVAAASTFELASAHQAGVSFGDAITLRSYNIASGPLHGGSKLGITLYWQALTRPTHDYTVFLHLIDPQGHIVAQVDTQPWRGRYPTSIWDAGEMVKDEYTLILPAGLDKGKYRVQIGLYEYPSMARLVSNGPDGRGDSWLLSDSILID